MSKIKKGPAHSTDSSQEPDFLHFRASGLPRDFRWGSRVENWHELFSGNSREIQQPTPALRWAEAREKIVTLMSLSQYPVG